MKVVKQHAEIVSNWNDMDLYERCEFAGRISHGSESKIKEGSAKEFVERMVKLGHESVFEFARVRWHVFNSNAPRCMNLRELRESASVLYDCGDILKALLLSISEKYPAFFPNLTESLKKFPLQKEWWKSYGYDDGYPIVWDSVSDWIPVMFTTNRAISHQLVRYRREIVFLQQSQRYVKFNGDVEFIEPSAYFDQDKMNDYHMYQVWKESMEGAEQDYIHALSQGYSAQAARLFLPNSAATKLIAYASPREWKHILTQRTSPYADPMMRELMVPLHEQFYGVMP